MQLKKLNWKLIIKTSDILKLSLQQEVEAHWLLRRLGSHIF
jgi:hypothetical protein